MAAAAGREQALLEVFNQPVSLEEKEALEFLYAFMPLSDLANLDGRYFLNQVRSALAAKQFFSWGKSSRKTFSVILFCLTGLTMKIRTKPASFSLKSSKNG